uniref:Phosphate cytidylyltransferase 1A, choline n=2 Tax=Ornithorhynchus anatinus TaxID=9258 RepID=A0A6I8NW89_ORNAN
MNGPALPRARGGALPAHTPRRRSSGVPCVTSVACGPARVTSDAARRGASAGGSRKRGGSLGDGFQETRRRGGMLGPPAAELQREQDADEAEPSPNTYILRPFFQHRFRPSIVKGCIHTILKEELATAQYVPEKIPRLTKALSETIKDKLKEMGFDRYKMVVQVVIGEQRGEGVNMAARCFWDADTDNYAYDVFMNDSLFCVAAAFGCFYY